MRQQHQKQRSRGRGRKQQNPLSRNFESNGPDVKIRGNASHIADKYTTLARDALSNSDSVMAENYFQHAEHYNRIVAAAQAQQAQQRQERQDNERQDSADRDESDDKAKSSAKPQDEGEQDAAKVSGQNGAKANGSNGSSHDANGADVTEEPEAKAGAEEEEKPKRKSTRTRRPRKNAEAQQSDDATPEQADVSVEAISDDAAKLPDSITGGMLAEES